MGVCPVMVAERCNCKNTTYTSVIHCLVSRVKKMQSVGGNVRGGVYRGRSGGELPAHFMKRGFAEWAFMSTTKELRVAICLRWQGCHRTQDQVAGCGNGRQHRGIQPIPVGQKICVECLNVSAGAVGQPVSACHSIWPGGKYDYRQGQIQRKGIDHGGA